MTYFLLESAQASRRKAVKMLENSQTTDNVKTAKKYSKTSDMVIKAKKKEKR